MYEVKGGSLEPANFVAGGYPIAKATGRVAAGKSVRQYEPVKLTDNGIEPVVKVEASAADSGSTTPARTEYENTTAGLYGIAADAAGESAEVVVYLTGEFFADAIALPDSVTIETLKKAFRYIGIFLK